MSYSELLEIDDSVISCMSFAMESVNSNVTEGIKVNSITDKDLQNPQITEHLKKKIKSMNSWQTALSVISKLNALLAGGAVVGGAYNDNKLSDTYVDRSQSISAQVKHHKELANAETGNRRMTIVVTLIGTAVATLSGIIRRSLRDKSIKDVDALLSKVNDNIKLYKNKLNTITDDGDRSKMEKTISNLESLKETIESEKFKLKEQSGFKKVDD